MEKRKVVHFGAGALGRGLVVPMLYQSKCSIVLVDTNEELIATLKDDKKYQLDISDDEYNHFMEIHIDDILSPVLEEERLLEYLKECNVVTTSVRRENLIHVAKVLVKAWGMSDNTENMVLCCENIENVGEYFKTLLLECAGNDTVYQNLLKVKVPDTIVDRICAASSDVTKITSEKFHECSVDKNVVEDTGIACIQSVDDITAHFYRKRYLLNTYADTMAFLGKAKGFAYLYEAAQDTQLNEAILPYIKLLMNLLEVKYGISKQESNNWFTIYRQRLSNQSIPREIDTVARNLWVKLSLSERFVFPLIELLEEHIDIREGICMLHIIIEETAKLQGYSQLEVQNKLKELWCTSELGKQLYTLYVEM